MLSGAEQEPEVLRRYLHTGGVRVEMDDIAERTDEVIETHRRRPGPLRNYEASE